MSLLQRAGILLLNVFVGPLLDARDSADESWRRSALTRQRHGLPSQESIRATLLALNGPLPAELLAPRPRPNVWIHPQRSKEDATLLMTGAVARGKVLAYERRGDVDGIDAAAIYAWLDESSNVRRHELAASFDPVHAGLGHTPTDASTLLELEEGRDITIVFDPSTGRHIVYEALGPRPAESAPILPSRSRA